MSKKSRHAPLGDLQHAVMDVLWSRGRATLAEVRSVLEETRPIAATTVATVLTRLEQSGLVSHVEGPRARVYAAAVHRSGAFVSSRLTQAITYVSMTDIDARMLDRELKKGSAELIILSILEPRSRHGYEISPRHALSPAEPHGADWLAQGRAGRCWQ
jgi:predicted transcriptional regulator